MNTATANDPTRPRYHFTPVANWINDPNGLVYYAGEYHLFYQYHPGSTVWGPMHWGHAISADLVHWKHLPIAFYPDELGAIFSGSAVIDWQNTAGFGKEAMVALFTHDTATGQKQSLAYSSDKGRTWTKYAGNPIIEPPPGEKDFRDPKVFWYDKSRGNGEATGHWVMLLAVGDSIWVYTSPNLINWTFASEFGAGHGVHDGVWETPDLFRLPVDGGAETRWVLTVGVGFGATVDRQGTQYFVGQFDGATFQSENSPAIELWADHGPDFYAAQGWNDAPNNRAIWIAWLNNWIYARELPTSSWRGAMTLPRELQLRTTPAGIRLVQQPVPELQQLRNHHWSWQNQIIEPGNHHLAGVRGAALEIMAEFQVDGATTADYFGVRVRTGDTAATVIGYQTQTQRLLVDRTQSGQVDFHAQFSSIFSTVLTPTAETIRLHIFVDCSSVEIFGNGGLAALTALVFPDADSVGMDLFAEKGRVVLRSLNIYQLGR